MAETNGKMNVLYLNHSGQMSGAEQSLRALLWQLRRAHPEVEAQIGLPGSGPFAQTLRDEGWSVTFAPLRRIERPQGVLSGMATLAHVLQTAPFVSKMVLQTRAQMVHSNSTTAHLVGSLAAERARVPSVWHVRDLIQLGRVAPQLAARSAWIIAISNCVAQQLQSEGVPPEKIRVIPNGLNPDEWRAPERSQLRESLGVPDDAFLFGCAGQLVPWKNHEEFIEAAALLCEDAGCSHARFVIMGGDLWGEHQEYVTQLRAKVKEHGLQDRFNFVPHQTNNVDALAAFDAVVLCSREEPFGRVLIEGMALEKVVIAYAANGPLEIITDGRDGLLVSPDTEGAMAAAMKRAINEPELSKSLGTQARKTVEEKFHIADSAARVFDLYREMLG